MTTDSISKYRQAPELQTAHWFNAEQTVTLESLRGRVVLIEAFQMLCPGCVTHGLPQAKRVIDTFSSKDVCVLGLHTVFEHHAAQGTREALGAFLHEYRISFPVGIDAASGNGGLPKTMATYGMQGTPSLILIDRNGRLRQQKFGTVEDMLLGAEIMALVSEADTRTGAGDEKTAENRGCDESACPIPSDPQGEGLK